VARTRFRPLPSGRVTVRQAIVFLAAQLAVGAAILFSLNRLSILLGVAVLGLIGTYPFMKRITYWPQLFLGLNFNWGALIGWTAAAGTLAWPPVLLYLGGICWTLGYDTIYAHQDKEDDALVGVRSTARLFGSNTKWWLVRLYGGALLFMAIAFALARVPLPALAGLVAAGVHMARQIRVLDIDDPDQCLSLFKSNSIVGWLLFAGIIAGHFS
jgi:4-hydroxybenzoate polyprenyltransferase